MSKTKLQPHELGALFPMMEEPAYKRLLESIKKDGYDKSQPVVLFEGKILDGNHRYTASEELGVKAEFKDFTGTREEAMALVVNHNLARRNLKPSQAAAIAAEIADKALATPEEAGSQGGRGKKKDKKGGAIKNAATAMNVSERSVKKALAVKRGNPEEFEQVKKGKKTINKASKNVEKQEGERLSKGELFQAALGILEKHIPSVATTTKLTQKEIITLSGLDADEVLRLKPMLEAGWKLKEALSYKSPSLSAKHSIQNLIDKAISVGTEFRLEIAGFEIIVKKA